MKEFEPIIVAFCCHYCAYTAADMAGSMRLRYPPNVKIIRVPCSHWVFVAGCLDGDCHFKNGNVRATHRVNYLQKLLDEIGIEGERVAMFEMSAGMGERFAQIATDFTEKIRQLGPNPAKVAQKEQRAAG